MQASRFDKIRALTMSFSDRQLLTTKFDGTFARITQTISQMKLVLMNSPDKNDFIERTMSMLFNPEDFETVISRLENLYLESHENRETQSDTNDFSTPRTDTVGRPITNACNE